MPLGIPEDSLLTIGASTIKGPSVVHSKVAAAPTPSCWTSWCPVQTATHPTVLFVAMWLCHAVGTIFPHFLLKLRVHWILFLLRPTTNFLFSAPETFLSLSTALEPLEY